MGNDVSRQPQQQEQGKQEDAATKKKNLEHLKFRFSCFSQEELRQLYESYHYTLAAEQQEQQHIPSVNNNASDGDDNKNKNGNKGSFFLKWLRNCNWDANMNKHNPTVEEHSISDPNSLGSNGNRNNDDSPEGNDNIVATAAADSANHQAIHLLAHVEQNILPSHFRKQLDCLTQVNQDDDNSNRNNHSSSSSSSTLQELEALLEVLANGSGRRGTRAAGATLFQCCAEAVIGNGSVPAGQQHSYGIMTSSCTDLVDQQGHEIKAKVSDVIDLAYRLAVAADLLAPPPTLHHHQSLSSSSLNSSGSRPNSNTNRNRAPSSGEDAHSSSSSWSTSSTPTTQSSTDNNNNNIKEDNAQKADINIDQHDYSALLILPPYYNSNTAAGDTTNDTTATTEFQLPLAIRSLAASCLDFVHQQRLNRSMASGTPDLDDADLEAGVCSKMDFLEWSQKTCPLLANTVLPTFLQAVWRSPEHQHDGGLCRFSFPRLKGNSLFFDNDQRMSLFAMACMSKSLGGSWHPLYTSESDGLSYDSLLNSLLGYGGPTLMIIHAGEATFGSYTSSQWKASKDYYGSPDCFLFQLAPQTGVYHPLGKGTNYMFCNDQKKKPSAGKLPCGLGFGGSAGRGPRLFLDETLSLCHALTRDQTFSPGPLLPRTDAFSEKIYFSVDHLEVWGCCSSADDADDGEKMAQQAFLCRQRERSLRASKIQNARRVDKAAFLGDLRTGLITCKAFEHMDQIHGSTRQHVLNYKNKNSYDYEE